MQDRNAGPGSKCVAKLETRAREQAAKKWIQTESGKNWRSKNEDLKQPRNLRPTRAHNDAAPKTRPNDYGKPNGFGMMGCLRGIVSSSCTWPFSGRRLPKAPPGH